MSVTGMEKSNGMIVHAFTRSLAAAARLIRSRPAASGPLGSAPMVTEIHSPGSSRRSSASALTTR